MAHDLRCALCDNVIEQTEYDLCKTFTLYSNTSLLDFLQMCLQEKITRINTEICKMCYILLNELDNIRIRAKIIEEQLKSYVNHYNSSNSKIVFTDDNIKNKLEECTVCREKIVVKEFKTHLKLQHPDLNDLDTSVNFDEINLTNEDINSSLDEINIFTNNATSGEIVKKESNERNEKRTVNKTYKAQRNKETNILKPYQCTECPKSWRTLTELKSHMSSHSNLKPYICEICGQAYKRQRALDVHVGMHNGINPFTCVYCNKSFTQKGALVRHTPIHTGELPFQCDLCGKRFVHHTSFNMHKLSHTGEKSYKCNVCGLFLISGSHLKRHMRVHTGEKKYACEICGKKFAEKYNLAAHEKLHSTDSKRQKFKCQICDCSYNRQIKLEEHLLIAHQKLHNPEEQIKK